MAPKLLQFLARRWPIVLALTASGAVLLLGLARYGGPEGLWRRVDAEIAARRPHPQFVPTPLPAATAFTAAAAPAATPRPTSAPTHVSEPGPPATASPTRQPATLTPTAAPTALPAHVNLRGLTHLWQTWNNCGPATLAMNLSYFGIRADQAAVAAALRPFRDDKNVSPDELAAFAQALGLAAQARVNGDAERLRQLLAAGLPVLIETWHEPKPNDGMGHYRLLTGYDDAGQAWIAYDSYDATGLVKGQPYAGIRLPYAGLDALWAVFNRAYLVIYDPPREAAVRRILGDAWDEAAMWRQAQAAAEAAAGQRPADPFTWFNLGSSLAALGDYGPAAEAFDRARRIGLPWRMLWYQHGPFRAYYEIGCYDEVIALADATLRSARDTIEEIYYWKGMAQAATGDPVSARASWQRALELNPNYGEARAALEALPE